VAHAAVRDDEPVLDAPAQRLASVCSVSSGRTGTTPCSTMGPWSSSGVTKWTVAPLSLQPASSTRRWVCSPGKAGSSEGWTFTSRPAQRCTKGAPSTRMKPASSTQSGAKRSTASARAASKASRLE
jgi:hypothetical protein